MNKETLSIVVTIIGNDRLGIVEPLSEILVMHNGNWVDSDMLSLAGKFAGVLLASVPVDCAESLIGDLQRLNTNELKITAEKVVETDPQPLGQISSLVLVSQDHPGIVHDLTSVLTRHNVNVEKLVTERTDASMSGEKMFHAEAVLLITAETDLRALQNDIEALSHELMAEIRLV